MNRTLRRAMERSKPKAQPYRPIRIPKIILQDRDFSQIELLMMKLAKGELEFEDGHYVMTAMDGERYCVVAALEGWIEHWKRAAAHAGQEYDDGALVRLKNRLDNGMLLTEQLIAEARQVVAAQLRLYQAMPAAEISSVATTTQIKLLMP